jgi:hypothetical protein
MVVKINTMKKDYRRLIGYAFGFLNGYFTNLGLNESGFG